ncbi:MAG: DUF2769 domain-containing protein [Halobacteriota archaeon]
MGKCICYKDPCPTFANNNLSGGLYCSITRCVEPLETKECICNRCLVWNEYNLTELYYCADGSEGW